MKKKLINIIVQSRLGSKRFPNKVLSSLGKVNITESLIIRLKKSKYANNLVFAIPDNKVNDKLFTFIKSKNVNIYRGSETNVLDRFYKTAKFYSSDIIVRITGDCPFIDYKLVDKFVKFFLKNKADYISNIYPATFPDGLDVEVFSFKALEVAKKFAKSQYEQEHVTTYIRNSGKFITKNLLHNNDLSYLKFSIDTIKNLVKAKAILKYFKSDLKFSYTKLLDKKIIKKLFKDELIKKKTENEKTKTGQFFWKKAKKLIPGGNMLLSKNPDRYLPGVWPTYFQSAKGCEIKDLDGNKFIDFSTMGVGTNVLGYANRFVDSGVKKAIHNGNMSTLNCKEEVLLAEKLIELHPWFHKVKFARTGGEANAVAIRIARAASGKDNVAFCGYHGWHDWYLSSNLNSKKKNLDTYLLKGLEIDGVPKQLKKTSFPFEYGNKNKLISLIKNQNIGVIKMEVCRNTEPDIKFLKFVSSVAKKNKIVLIFDECTTGFRQSIGGLHAEIKIIPDIAIFGKALGNGYPITAIIGKDEVMNAANKSFISSTFWSDRIGPAAALKTIEYMQKNKTWKQVYDIGKKIQKNWENIAKHNNLDIKINGIYSLSSFTFKSTMHQKYKTLITQEMLKNNMLASNVFYPSISHNDKLLQKYYNNLNDVFKTIKLCEEGSDIRKYLKTETSLKDFKRLN